VVVSQWMIFAMEMSMLFITNEQAFSYIQGSDQQLRGKNLFVIRCCMSI
jgi:hypothetical protein